MVDTPSIIRPFFKSVDIRYNNKSGYNIDTSFYGKGILHKSNNLMLKIYVTEKVLKLIMHII